MHLEGSPWGQGYGRKIVLLHSSSMQMHLGLNMCPLSYGQSPLLVEVSARINKLFFFQKCRIARNLTLQHKVTLWYRSLYP